MEPLNLPNGWYDFPGDGKGPKPTDRPHHLGGRQPPRQSYMGWVQDGMLVFIWGLEKDVKAKPPGTDQRDSPRVLGYFTQAWGIHPQELLRETYCQPVEDDWITKLVLEP